MKMANSNAPHEPAREPAISSWAEPWLTVNWVQLVRASSRALITYKFKQYLYVIKFYFKMRANKI